MQNTNELLREAYHEPPPWIWEELAQEDELEAEDELARTVWKGE